MKKKVLSILLVSVLSLSLFVGCTNTTDVNNSGTSNQEQQESVNNNEEFSAENKEDEPSFENKEEESNTVVEEVTEDQIESKFTEVLEFLYNRDYSNEEQAIEAENYIKDNFTPEGAENMINTIITYCENVSYSDLLITLVKNVENNDDRYKSMYEIRYNISVAIGKPSIYSDVIAKVVVDRNNTIFIESINDFQF